MRDHWLIDAADRASLERYLTSAGLLQLDETPIEIARAGAGNMNLALRVSTPRPRSFVVKQARPWVEKYPHIPAPFDRTLVEAAFYEAVRPEPRVASRMPALLHVDGADHILVLEDVGREGDFTTMYADSAMPSPVLGALLDWLRDLARVPFPDAARAALANRAMRALNHEHIFVFPLREANGHDLDAITPGLAAAARELARDEAYRDAVHAVGDRYLADGRALVHGDFFPGSWLKDAGG